MNSSWRWRFAGFAVARKNCSGKNSHTTNTTNSKQQTTMATEAKKQKVAGANGREWEGVEGANKKHHNSGTFIVLQTSG